MLHSRGQLDLDAPVAQYWPEFAVSGKEGVLVRHRAEVVGADFHIGLDPSEFGRIANVIPPPPLPFDLSTLDPNMVVIKTLTGPTISAETSWTPQWRQVDIGAANGHGNPRSMALVQSAISNGGVVNGHQLLAQSSIDQIFREQANGVDQVLMMPMRFGIGYGPPSELMPLPPDRRICFWGGWGGSVVINDLDTRMTFTFAMNEMGQGTVGDSRAFSLLAVVLAALG